MKFPLKKYFFLLLPLTFLVMASACHHQAQVTGVTVEYVELNGKRELHDTAIANMITPYKTSLDAEMNVVLAISDTAMPKERGGWESLLGNFTADAVLHETNVFPCSNADSCRPQYHADMVLLNTGGLRTSLPKGNITKGNIYELMPFDNEIVILTLSGKQTWEMLRFIAASGGSPVAGLNMGVKNDKSPGTVLIGGMALDTTKTYTVATSDYLANGGDKMNFFKDPVKTEVIGLKIRDALIRYCMDERMAGKHLHPVLDGRLHYEPK